MVNSESCMYQPNKLCLGREDDCPEDCKYNFLVGGNLSEFTIIKNDDIEKYVEADLIDVLNLFSKKSATGAKMMGNLGAIPIS